MAPGQTTEERELRLRHLGELASMARICRAAVVATAGSAFLLLGAGPVSASSHDCPNAEFRTGASALLPDCRAYEQVSPTDKGNGSVGGGDFVTGTLVNPSGNAALWGATDAFLGATSFAAAVPYSSYRTASDWTTRSFGWRPVLPPNIFGSGGTIQNPYLLSEDGTKSLTVADRNPVTGEEVVAVFIVDLLTGEATQLNGQPVGSSGGFFGVGQNTVGADPDFENIWFGSSWELTQEAVGISGRKLYHYSVADAELSLASYDPAGDPASGDLVSQRSIDAPMKNYVSEDGQVASFYGAQASGTTRRFLYRAEVGIEESVLVTAAENPGSPGPEAGDFQGADTSGDRIFFKSTGELLPGAEGDHLYLYDHTEPAGSRLTLISEDQHPIPQQANVGSAVGNSDDGSVIYFTAAAQLIPGEDDDSGQKLYRWEEGNLEFLARINQAPNKNSLVSADGRYAVFMSPRNLEPGVDTGGFAQAYRYDHQTGEIACVSCDPNGANTAAAELGVGFLNTIQITVMPRRFLTDNGRVTFNTEDALIPERDTNNQTDVYTWQNGELDLISTGRSESPSRFADVSADGSSIFFTTREQLVSSDTDDAIDLYAARVNGGIAGEQLRTHSPCTGSACQGGSPAAPERQGDATQDYNSNDQVTPTTPLRIAARAQRVSNRGFTRVGVRASQPGRMILHGPAIRNAGTAFSQAGVQVVRAHLTPRAKRLLIRRGALRTRARVVFRAHGGGGAIRQVPLTFRLKGGNR